MRFFEQPKKRNSPPEVLKAIQSGDKEALRIMGSKGGRKSAHKKWTDKMYNAEMIKDARTKEKELLSGIPEDDL